MFSEILARIVSETHGGIAAFLMGYDGIAVDQHVTPVEGMDMQLLVVEYANVLKEIKSAIATLNTGLMEEVAVKTDRYFVILRSITDEYFVIFLVARSGNYGKARYVLMRDAAALLEGLA